MRRFSARASCVLAHVIMVAPLATSAFAEPQRALSRIDNTRQNWTIRYEIRYGGVIDSRGAPGRAVDSGVAWSPIMPNTAMSDAHRKDVTGTLKLRPAQTITDFEVFDGYACGASYASWNIPPCKIEEVSFTVELPVSSYETRIDERRANQRVWPSAPWDTVLASCLEPQNFVESDDVLVGRLVERWTNGKPKRAKPYMLAKYLASKVLEYGRINDSQFKHDSGAQVTGRRSVSYVKGFDVSGAAAFAQQKRGTRYDLACMLCAVYRAAGLPARLVIGIDEPAQSETSLPMAHAWVEFFLPFEEDEDAAAGEFVAEADGEWIPVDIYRQQQFSSRPPSLDRPWNFFGNNEYGESLAPFALHWTSPDTSHAYPEAYVSPIGLGTSPRLFVQTGGGINTTIMGTAKRGGY